jgi:hypothetical protein
MQIESRRGESGAGNRDHMSDFRHVETGQFFLLKRWGGVWGCPLPAVFSRVHRADHLPETVTPNDHGNRLRHWRFLSEAAALKISNISFTIGL